MSRSSDTPKHSFYAQISLEDAIYAAESLIERSHAEFLKLDQAERLRAAARIIEEKIAVIERKDTPHA